jgi:isocitrate dehydrogenase
MSATQGKGASTVVTLIPGDGIGPEVVDATVRIIEASGVKLTWEKCEAGAGVFKKGVASGVPRETVESIARTRVVLKGPLETPVGYGEKSANVTLRKLFETYANVRPVREWPGVRTPYSGRGLDLVVVRENVEDLYAGIEHQQTYDVAQCLKLISRSGSEKAVRLAYELARAEGRKRLHAATKANIMKLTEGTMKRAFEALAPEYPDIESQHIIIDNCAHQLVRRPEQFDVIVTTNMNGDIISDLTSALVGGLGFAPSANLGRDVAIFEAVHGSAPKYAGQDVANPTAVLMSAVMMLRHLGRFDEAMTIEKAVLVTLEQGTVTRDVGEGKVVGTRAYADAVIANLGKDPKAPVRTRRPYTVPTGATSKPVAQKQVTVGADVFVEHRGTPDALGQSLEAIVAGSALKLKMISNRGTKVYPATGALPDCVDHWRCRFVASQAGGAIADADLLKLIQQVGAQHRWMHVERLQSFEGADGFTRAQGED